LKISEKLDENFLLISREQLEPIINALNNDFIYYPEIPPEFLQNPNSTMQTKNPEYRVWNR